MPLNPAPVDLPTEFSVVEAALDRPGVACHVAAVAKHVAGGEGEFYSNLLKNMFCKMQGLTGANGPQVNCLWRK